MSASTYPNLSIGLKQLPNNNIVGGGGAGASITTAPGNTLVGVNAGDSITTAANNVVIGYNAGIGIIAGGSHVIVGQQAGQATGVGAGNTDCIAIGYQALQTYAGSSNIAIGSQALQLATGTGNVAVGFGAGSSIVAGTNDTMLGYRAGQLVTGSNLTAVGQVAAQGLASNASQHITAIGSFALQQIGGAGGSTANDNTALGYSAGFNVQTGTQNTFVGSLADNVGTVDTTGATGVGYNVSHGANNTTTLGSACAATAAGGVAIGIDSGGTSAAAGTANWFVLGTSNHLVKFSNNTTGAGSALLGANCPAVTVSAPNTWIRVINNAGSTGYIPMWV